MPVNFDEALAAVPDPRRGSVCYVARAASELTPSDAKAFLAAVDAGSITATRLARAVSMVLGWKLGDHSIRRHRRGDCECEPVE